jgi:hypothetical protein
MPEHWPARDQDAPSAVRGSFPALDRPAGRVRAAHGGEPAPGHPLTWPPDGFGAPFPGGNGVAAATAAAQRNGRSREWADWLSADRADRFTGQYPPSADAGAPAGLTGRLAPEWSASGTSRRIFLRRAPARTDGGVMVRRALLDRGDELTADGALPPELLPDRSALAASRPTSAGSARAAGHWRGAGGRWLVWVGRVVVWAVILLIGYRGVLAIVDGQGGRATGSATDRTVAATQFPVTTAEAYALEFGNVYLNYSPATAAARSAALAVFLPPGADAQLGWNGAGTQRLLDEQVGGIKIRSGHAAVVTVLAQLADGSLVTLGVPIYASGGGMSVSGEPALLPGPAMAVAQRADQAGGDQATAAALQSQLAGFFQAYASGDQATLARFLTPGAQLTGLAGAVRFGAIDAVYAPVGGSIRDISVTVSWLLPSQPQPRSAGATASAPAGLQMTYEMTVVRRNGTWDVRSIGAATQPLVQGPP